MQPRRTLRYTTFQAILSLDYEAVSIQKGDTWELWKATPKIYGAPPTHFLYLGHDATISGARTVAQELRGKKYSLVYRDSSTVAAELDRAITEYGATSAEAFTQFAISTALQDLVPLGQVDPPKHFIEPALAEDRPALAELEQWLLHREADDAHIGVLLAPAGIGKTTVSEALYSRLHAGRRWFGVPILVTSETWKDLATQPTIQLWDIWQSAMRHSRLDRPPTGYAFAEYLRASILLPIFDGFDELCSLPTRQFEPATLLGDLDKLAGMDARILLTSRTDFWRDSVGDDLGKRVKVFELQPFQRRHVSLYLERRFEGDRSSIDAVQGALARLKGSLKLDSVPPPDWLGGIPLVLDMLSRWVESHPKAANKNPALFGQRNDKDPLYEIITSLLDREKNRHTLPLDAEGQLRMLCQLAIECGEVFSAEQVFAAIPAIGDQEVLERIYASFEKNHALLKIVSEAPDNDNRGREADTPRAVPEERKGALGRSYRFRFEFLRPYLSAYHITTELRRERSLTVGVAGMLGERLKHDYATHDFIARELELREAPRDGYDLLNHVARECLRSVTENSLRETTARDIRGALTSILLHLLDRQRVQSHSERREMLIALLGSDHRTIQRATLLGSLRGLDFRDTEIREMRFVDVVFDRCEFDHDTTFWRSEFAGEIRRRNCEGDGAYGFRECSFDPAAKVTFGVRGATVAERRAMNLEEVKQAINECLKKFSHPGRGFARIRREQRFTGKLAASPILHHLWHVLDSAEVVGRVGMDEIAIRSEAEGDVRRLLSDNMAVGTLKKAIDLFRE